MLQKVYRDIAFTCSKRFHIPTSSIKIANQTVVDVSKVYSRKTNAVKQANHKKKKNTPSTIPNLSSQKLLLFSVLFFDHFNPKNTSRMLLL